MQVENQDKKNTPVITTEAWSVTYSDAERVRRRLGLSIGGMCMYLGGINRSTYLRWDERGMPGTAQNLIRVLDMYPGEVLRALAPKNIR